LITLAWRLLTLVCLTLGLAGLVLPLLPTVPFLLLAAWSASRAWPEMERRLVEHPVYGPPIRRWRERGAVPRRAKWFATVGMAGSAVALWVSGGPAWLPPLGTCLLASVALWIWSRPDA
jgi:uncharacterized membrane protein YbaN (DUF454 family)